MFLENYRRQAALSWLFVGTLLALCGVLGFLQYRWIGEVSVAARERLQASLRASLFRLSQDFNSEITSIARAMLRDENPAAAEVSETEMAARYDRWKKSSRHASILKTLALAVVENGTIRLRRFDFQSGAFESTDWPAGWKPLRERLEAHLAPGPWGRPPEAGLPERGLVFEMPLFLGMAEPERRRAELLVCELDSSYIAETYLPELIQHHLGQEFQVEVTTRGDPPETIYRSDAGPEGAIGSRADASAGLFELQYERLFRPGRGNFSFRVERTPPPPDRRRRPFLFVGPPPGAPRALIRQDPGRWQIAVRHRSGSLEALVARTRVRNLAVTGGILLLMVASVAALVSFMRRAQRLAELQMDFVAGVSHELRTPLTVIHTAAYNLQGRVASNPSQVERYGVLIQKESGRLRELVEQVLSFARTKAGRTIQETEPLSPATLIDDTLEANRTLFQQAGCVVEKIVPPDLPLIQADPLALKHALQNLLCNAVKYGLNGSNWIGVEASKTTEKGKTVVELRVSDRGPGIPPDEQRHVFDPFFRGRRAVEDQIHGAGLGLNLVRKIVEAHGGSVSVKSQPGKGTEFALRIPAAPSGAEL